MTHGSLFSGIGGFDLAARWMGWDNLFHCEFDPFCQRVLAHHFPNSKLYNDVKTFDATIYRGRLDVLSGGFPCQPFSSAGKRKGTDDDRHLWPEMLRIIREISPRYVLGENVRGLLNWSGKDGRVGMVFEEVCTDLETAGYEVTPYLLPACSINAPHRRDRIFFVAQNSDENGRGSFKRKEESNVRRFGNIGAGDNVGVPSNDAEVRDATDTDRIRLEYGPQAGDVQKRAGKTQGERRNASKPVEANGLGRNATDTDIELPKCGNGNREDGRSEQTQRTQPLDESRGWEEFPTQPPICGGDDGLPRKLDAITFPKWRKESIKAYGNAIVPQVALQIFKAIQLTEAQRANY